MDNYIEEVSNNNAEEIFGGGIQFFPLNKERISKIKGRLSGLLLIDLLILFVIVQ